ncbi:exopolyphosphatase [Candidatus Amoebophilus asiaticus]|nr:exopolyphosphatase [Candidatus Amoebophilus asiaticus]
MRLAVIDLGTNTFHLLIAETSEGNKYQLIYKTKHVVKLLTDEAREGYPIPPDAFERGLNSISDFQKIIKKNNADKILCFATSALRSTSNQSEFIESVKEQTGIDIQIITGIEEAKFIFHGVKQAMDIGLKKCLIMDIGGGSVEFIIADQNQIFWSNSYNIGAARLKDRFHKNDPITLQECKALENHLEIALEELIKQCKKFQICNLIGASGSFDTFIEMDWYHSHNKKMSENQVAFDLPLVAYQNIHQRLVASTYEERLEMKGMKAFRADMIVVASVLTNFVIERLGIEKIRVSAYALKEGVIQKECKTVKTD